MPPEAVVSLILSAIAVAIFSILSRRRVKTLLSPALLKSLSAPSKGESVRKKLGELVNDLGLPLSLPVVLLVGFFVCSIIGLSVPLLSRSEGVCVSSSVAVCRDRDVHAAVAAVRRRVAVVGGEAKIRNNAARYMTFARRRDMVVSFTRMFQLVDEKLSY